MSNCSKYELVSYVAMATITFQDVGPQFKSTYLITTKNNYFETNVSDKSFVEEQRFEAIIASLSSSNNKYR